MLILIGKLYNNAIDIEKSYRENERLRSRIRITSDSYRKTWKRKMEFGYYYMCNI